MDSSLILLAIIALSGAYLMPHAVRRREQLSAARATDRFSSAMRVLARRPFAGADRRAAAHSRGTAERPELLSSPRLRTPRPDVPAGRASTATKQVRLQSVSRPSRGARWFPCAGLALSVLLAAAGAAAAAAGATPDLGPRLGVAVAPLWWAVAGAGQLVVVLALLRLRARRRAARRRNAVRLVPLLNHRSDPSAAPVVVVEAPGPGTGVAPPAAVELDEPALALRPA